MERGNSADKYSPCGNREECVKLGICERMVKQEQLTGQQGIDWCPYVTCPYEEEEGKLWKDIPFYAAWACHFEEVCEEKHCPWSGQFDQQQGGEIKRCLKKE